MAWTTLDDLTTGDLVTEAQMDAIRENINYNRSPLVEETLNIANFSTTSTSYVDVTGVTDTITTTGTALRIIVLCSLDVASGASAGGYLNLDIDGTAVTADADGLVQMSLTSGERACALVFVKTGLTAGAHTVKLQAKAKSVSYAFKVINASIQLIDAA